MDLNKVVLIGRLVEQPEMRYTPNGKAVTDITLAVNGYREDEVSFIDVVCWGGTAEAVANNLEKGSQVAVEGELQQDRWQTDKGQNRSKVKVTANRIQFLTYSQNGTSEKEEEIASEDIDIGDINDDELPF